MNMEQKKPAVKAHILCGSADGKFQNRLGLED